MLLCSERYPGKPSLGFTLCLQLWPLPGEVGGYRGNHTLWCIRVLVSICGHMEPRHACRGVKLEAVSSRNICCPLDGNSGVQGHRDE